MDLEEKIFTQISYYFSDSNLKIDKFMQNLTGTETTTENEECGLKPVNIEEFLKFTKVRDLAGDIYVVFRSIKKHIDLGTIKFNTELVYNFDKKTLARKNPFVYVDSTDKVIFVECDAETPFKTAIECYNYLHESFSEFGNILSIRSTFLDEKLGSFYSFIEFDNQSSIDAIKHAVKEQDTSFVKIKEMFCKHVPEHQSENSEIPLKILTFSELSVLKREYNKLKSQQSAFEKKLFKHFAKHQSNFEQLFHPKINEIKRENLRQNAGDNHSKEGFQSQKRLKIDNNDSKQNPPDGMIIKFNIFSNNLESINIKNIKKLFQSFLENSCDCCELAKSGSKLVEYLHIDNEHLSIVDYPDCIQSFYIRTLSQQFATLSSTPKFLNDLKDHFQNEAFQKIESKILSDDEKLVYWNNCKSK